MHLDLLAQAETLAMSDPNRPRQANLRRAVSSVYYALFHYLVSQACVAAIGSQHGQRGFRNALARAFEHSAMKNVCEKFKDGFLSESTLRALPACYVERGLNDRPMRLLVPAAIVGIAATFVETQQKRHQADYDLAVKFLRHDVIALIAEVRAVIENFESLEASDPRQFFLVCLFVGKSPGGRVL